MVRPCFASILIMHLFNPQTLTHFWNNLSENALSSTIQITGVVLFYMLARFLAFRVIDGTITRIFLHDNRMGMPEGRVKRLQTLQGLIKSVLGYILGFVFGVLLLRAVGFDILPVVTTASVLGVAVALGSQKLFKDIISGFFLIVDNLFGVGDVVTIGTATGVVEEVGMRVTRLRDATGKEHLLANGDIGTVINLSRHPVEEFVEINVSPTADLEKAIRAMNETGIALLKVEGHTLKSAPAVLGVPAFTKDLTTLRISVVTDPMHLEVEKMRVREALRLALIASEIPLG